MRMTFKYGHIVFKLLSFFEGAAKEWQQQYVYPLFTEFTRAATCFYGVITEVDSFSKTSTSKARRDC